MLKFTRPVGGEAVIRPVPFISINQNPIRNKKGLLGSYYTITLTGSIIPDRGSPNSDGAVSSAYADQSEDVQAGSRSLAIISKQNGLRKLFSEDGLKLEVLPASLGGGPAGNLGDEPVLKCYLTVESISFEEGNYIGKCNYTVNLRAEMLLDNDDNVLVDGNINAVITGLNTETPTRNNGLQDIDAQLDSHGGFIEDYSETWSIEVDEGKGNTSDSFTDTRSHISSSRAYRLTRSISATGRTIYTSGTNRKEAWQQAKAYIYKSVLKDTDTDSNNNSTGYEQYPEYTLGPYFGSGFLNINKNQFGGYNHLRTESIDVTAGTVTVNDTWILSSGVAHEDYKMSLSKGSDNGLHKVSIDGTIKGLSSAQAGHSQYGGSNTNPPNLGNPLNTQYENALYKFNTISNNRQYGPTCILFKRANEALSGIDYLNHVPLSIALGTNPFTGEITYNIEYDTRPLNAISGALSENISFSDTYPGDVFVVIPVIGRQTGPILQYIGGRTEYQRSLSIDLIMDKYYTSGAGDLKTQMRQYSALSKPSINEPFRSQINSVIQAHSPSQEVGIRKYFVSPPTETWDAKSGRYSLNINWTYELDK